MAAATQSKWKRSATVDFSPYFRGRAQVEHTAHKTGHKFDDPAYFSPTHRRLLDSGPSWIMPQATASATLDKATHEALWNARVYEDLELGGVFVVVRRDSGGGWYYIRVFQGQNGELTVFHGCMSVPLGADCHHIPLAVCAFESVRREDTPMKKLAAAVKKSGEPNARYEGDGETAFVRLQDELYYHMRYELKMESGFELICTRAPRKAFNEHHGRELVVGSDTLKRAGKGKAARSKAKPRIDWGKFRIRRQLNEYERGLVPADVFYKDRMGEELLATDVAFRGDPLIIVGPAGVGKSRLARRVFEHLGLPLTVISASSDRDFYDMVKATGLKGGETVEVEAKLLTAARRGYGLLIDEIASLRPERAMLFNSVLQERELDLGTETIRLHDDCRIIATCNLGDEYVGSIGLDPSTMDRFVPVHLDYLEEKAEVDVVARESGNGDGTLLKKMVKVAGRTRAAYEHGEMSKPVTTRDLIRWAKYTNDRDPLEVAELILVRAVARDDEEMLAFRDLLEETFS